MAAKRVDVHHHFVPPFYAQALQDRGGDPSRWKTPEWTLEKDMQFNKQEGIAFTFQSMTAPGTSVLPLNEQVDFCRKVNNYAAAIRDAHPTRYGFFASIPSLLDPAAAHRELLHALDTLHADGITLYTRYGAANHYLGHPDFRATWALLDARRAVVFVHPTHPADTAPVNPRLPQPMIDYPHETTRAAVDLLVSGTLRAHPGVKVILPHAGGTLPYLALRPAALLPFVEGADADSDNGKATELFLEDARRFYFDIALSAGHLTLDLLKGFARPGHVLFGSDFPYAPASAIRHMDALLDQYGGKDLEFVQEIERAAALDLFPRLKGTLKRSSL
ncbi:putative amidohydrolase family protein [Botryosphaeria dothidea]|uniref:6-methylsalicylate decarboxylase n=1 Tax=Botryosphaeria dothidea TaxID=55169 RepID=A0A8H4ILY5_9PEZI|nr:putative amidohydrolase family protein [Botryosphaeria dothidea]